MLLQARKTGQQYSMKMLLLALLGSNPVSHTLLFSLEL
jgi:hypothetical protein